MDDFGALNVGDTVFISGDRSMQMTTVQRTTKTLVVTATGDRFRKIDGRKVGHQEMWYYRPRLMLDSDASRQKYEEYQRMLRTVVLRRRISNALPELDLKTLEEIAALIP